MRLSRILCNKNLALLIDSYSNYNPSPLSLKKFTDFGKNLGEEKKAEWKQNEFKSFMFLKEELLVRIALMSKEMHYLPDKLINTSSVQLVHSWYLKSFEEILSLKSMKPTEDKLKA
jgi:pyruvate dehydrogenase kinase 2/3/4